MIPVRVEPVVNEGVDHDQARSCGEPPLPLLICAHHEVREGHRDDLAADPMRGCERPEKGRSHPLSSIRRTR
jgi:hypothetical protein